MGATAKKNYPKKSETQNVKKSRSKNKGTQTGPGPEKNKGARRRGSEERRMRETLDNEKEGGKRHMQSHRQLSNDETRARRNKQEAAARRAPHKQKKLRRQIHESRDSAAKTRKSRNAEDGGAENGFTAIRGESGREGRPRAQLHMPAKRSSTEVKAEGKEYKRGEAATAVGSAKTERRKVKEIEAKARSNRSGERAGGRKNCTDQKPKEGTPNRRERHQQAERAREQETTEEAREKREEVMEALANRREGKAKRVPERAVRQLHIRTERHAQRRKAGRCTGAKRMTQREESPKERGKGEGEEGDLHARAPPRGEGERKKRATPKTATRNKGGAARHFQAGGKRRKTPQQQRRASEQRPEKAKRNPRARRRENEGWTGSDHNSDRRTSNAKRARQKRTRKRSG